MPEGRKSGRKHKSGNPNNERHQSSLDEILQHLANGLVALAEGQKQLQATVSQLVEWQQRTQGTIAQLVEGQQHLQQAVIHLTEENRRLAEGQQRLQETVAHLTGENRRLAEGQQRLQETVAELAEENRRLAEGQQRLRETVADLAEGQRRLQEVVVHLTEENLRLAEGQQRLQEAVFQLTDENRRLVEGQQRLQETIAELAKGQQGLQRTVEQLAEENRKMSVVLKEVNKKVGRLDEQWGMTVEGVAQLFLPRYLESEHGIKLKGRPGYQLRPMFFRLNGEWEQVDLYGEGTKNGEEVCVVCECKAKIYGRDVIAFIKKLDRLWLHLRKRPIAVMFGYSIHPTAEEPASSRNIILVNPLIR